MSWGAPAPKASAATVNSGGQAPQTEHRGQLNSCSQVSVEERRRVRVRVAVKEDVAEVAEVEEVEEEEEE